jgi:hypothetical protein
LSYYEFFIHDYRNAIIKAEKQGFEQGKKQSLEIIQRGLEQGKSTAKLEMAKQLLDLLDDAAISKTTGLSLLEIAELRNRRSQVQ